MSSKTSTAWKNSRWRKLIIFLLFVFLLTSCGMEADDTDLDRLSVIDGVLTNENGDPVQLRGLSTHGIAWYPEYLTEETFRTLKKAGANVVRAAMYTDANRGYLENPEENLALITQAIDCAKATGLYVIVDWHILEDGDPTLHQEEATAFFEYMASQYPNDPAILYEICNEPNGTSWETICSYADRIFPVIRTHSPDAVIILGTPDYSSDLSSAIRQPYDGTNFLYAYHFYAGLHERTRILEYALEQQVPIIVSEWGIDSDENGDPALAEGEAFVTDLNDRGISWCAWSLSNKAEVYSVLQPDCEQVSGWRNKELTDVGRVIFAALRGSEK